jgi:hypothetical protein
VVISTSSFWVIPGEPLGPAGVRSSERICSTRPSSVSPAAPGDPAGAAGLGGLESMLARTIIAMAVVLTTVPHESSSIADRNCSQLLILSLSVCCPVVDSCLSSP